MIKYMYIPGMYSSSPGLKLKSKCIPHWDALIATKVTKYVTDIVPKIIIITNIKS